MDGEGLALVVGLGVGPAEGVGVGVGVVVGRAGTGEMAERVAACADDAEVWGAARELAGAPAEGPAEDAGAATELAAAAELTAAELPVS